MKLQPLMSTTAVVSSVILASLAAAAGYQLSAKQTEKLNLAHLKNLDATVEKAFSAGYVTGQNAVFREAALHKAGAYGTDPKTGIMVFTWPDEATGSIYYLDENGFRKTGEIFNFYDSRTTYFFR